jgi:hypothetical protein
MDAIKTEKRTRKASVRRVGSHALAVLPLMFVIAPFLGSAPHALACTDQDAFSDPRAQQAVDPVAAQNSDVAAGEQDAQQRAAANGTLNSPGYLNQRISIVFRSGYTWNCDTGTFQKHGVSAGQTRPVQLAPVPTNPPAAAGPSPTAGTAATTVPSGLSHSTSTSTSSPSLAVPVAALPVVVARPHSNSAPVIGIIAGIALLAAAGVIVVPRIAKRQ